MKYLYFVTFVHLFMFTSSQTILDNLRWTRIKAFFLHINDNFYKDMEII